MKHHLLRRMALAALGAMVILTGCAATQNMAEKTYLVEKNSNPQTSFTQIWAVQDDGGVRISGKIRLKTRVGFNVPGYVEVLLASKEGSILDRQKVDYFPRTLTGGKGHREARFVAFFPKAPPTGAIIRLSTFD